MDVSDSSTPAANSTNTFNAIWETGAAVGNTFLIGNGNPTSYPSGYPATRFYGITSNNNWSSGYWSSGSYVISFSQTGNILTLSALYSSGAIASTQTLSYVSAGTNTTSTSTTAILAGIYKDTSGNQYQVSGRNAHFNRARAMDYQFNHPGSKLDQHF